MMDFKEYFRSQLHRDARIAPVIREMAEKMCKRYEVY
jgi:hypothetical protein